MTDINYALIVNTGTHPMPNVHPAAVLALYVVTMLVIAGFALWYADIGTRPPYSRQFIPAMQAVDYAPAVMAPTCEPDAVFCTATQRWRDPKTKRFVKRQDRLPRH